MDVVEAVPFGDLDLVGHHHPDAPLFLLPSLVLKSVFWIIFPSISLSLPVQPLDKIDNLSILSQPLLGLAHSWVLTILKFVRIVPDSLPDTLDHHL
jgi:hypothetical protein